MSRLGRQLFKRDVTRVAAAYLAFAWLGMQILDVIGPVIDIPEWLPRVALISLAVGFPVAIVLAWSFRLTPEGVEVDQADSPTAAIPFGSRKIDFAIIGALALVIVFMVVERRINSPGPDSAAPSFRVDEYKHLTEAHVVLPPFASPLPMIADQSRLHFVEFRDVNPSVSVVHRNGGDVVPAEMWLDGEDLFGLPVSLSADDSELLFAVGTSENFDPYDPNGTEIWSKPLIGGSAKPFGIGRAMSFSNDRTKAVMIRGNSEIHVGNADMSDVSLLITLPYRTYWPKFSQDGSSIRVTSFFDFYAGTIWEIDIDNPEEPRRLFESAGFQGVCCGSWTADWRFYVFQARTEDGTHIWAIDESEWESGVEPTPFQLTSGPLDYLRPLASDDGKEIYAIGWQLRGELTEFNTTSQTYGAPRGMQGVSGDQVSFSRDGRSATYVSYPDGHLWRRDITDGKSVQLTFGEMRVGGPVWSPDAELIAFEGWIPGEPRSIFVIPSAGGKLRKLSAQDGFDWSPTWDATGKKIAFSRIGSTKPIVVDVDTGNEQELNTSIDLYEPKWSPDGKLIAGHPSFDGENVFGYTATLLIIDAGSGEIAKTVEFDASIDDYEWSASGDGLYLTNAFLNGGNFGMFWLGLDSDELEEIAIVGRQAIAWGTLGRWVGISPDGAPMFLRDLSIHDIYALQMTQRD